MLLPRGTYVRHIDGDSTNNRRENLLLVKGRSALPRQRSPSTRDTGAVIIDFHDVVMRAMIAERHPNARVHAEDGTLIARRLGGRRAGSTP